MKSAEHNLLSYIIFNPNFYLLRASDIHEGIFTSEKNKSVLKAIKTLLHEGRKVNTITISEILNFDGSLEFLSEIVESNVYGDIDDVINFLGDNYKDTTLKMILSESISKIGSDGWQEATVYLTQRITELNENTTRNYNPIKVSLDSLMEVIHLNRTSKNVIGIGTGLKSFDTFSGGLQLSDLVVLAGKTSMGKTSLSLTIARNAATDFKVPTVIYSLEMSEQQITARAASMESSVSSKRILNSKLEPYEVDAIKSSISEIYEAKLFIATTSNKIQNILSSMVGYILKEGAKLFFVDYLQLVSLGVKGINREQEVGQMARIFKNFAKENNVCIVLLSQLKRGEDKKEPMLSDLRDSGQIEEAADVVMFIHRPEYFGIQTFEDDGEPTAGKAEIIIAKGRNIGVGRFRVSFIASLTKFHDKAELTKLAPSNEFDAF